MSEYSSNSHENQFEPRGRLFERLHDFFIQALTEQTGVDEHARQVDDSRILPGSLYKIDGGFLKIHLQPPASDLAMSKLDGLIHAKGHGLPFLWLQMPLIGEDATHVLDKVFASEVILMHVQRPGASRPEMGYEVTPHRFKCIDVDEFIDTSRLLEPDSDIDKDGKLASEETEAATKWLDLLEHYDLRSIMTNGETAA